MKKALYGLKQAPRAWYARIDSYLMKLGLIRSEADPNLYFKVEDDKPLILVLYVDDLFLQVQTLSFTNVRGRWLLNLK